VCNMNQNRAGQAAGETRRGNERGATRHITQFRAPKDGWFAANAGSLAISLAGIETSFFAVCASPLRGFQLVLPCQETLVLISLPSPRDTRLQMEYYSCRHFPLTFRSGKETNYA
jgi:hypothetical protein